MPKQFINLGTPRGLVLIMFICCAMGTNAPMKFEFKKPFIEKLSEKLILKLNDPCQVVNQVENYYMNKGKVELQQTKRIGDSNI